MNLRILRVDGITALRLINENCGLNVTANLVEKLWHKRNNKPNTFITPLTQVATVTAGCQTRVRIRLDFFW